VWALLRDEVISALTGAFGKLCTGPDNTGGISGDYLPLFVDRGPFSQSLVADDERTFLASAERLGGPVVPSAGIATCFTGDSSCTPGWAGHPGTDSLGRPRASHRQDRGRCAWFPAPHVPEYERQLCAGQAASGYDQPGWPDWPHVVVETQPADVVIFHAHLFNCARGGVSRLAWTIDYLAWPGLGDAERMRLVGT
jgi:hypothetical protein